jgi:integrase
MQVKVADVVCLYLRYSEREGVHCQEALEERRKTLGAFSEMYGGMAVEQLKPFCLVDFLDRGTDVAPVKGRRVGWKSPATRRHKANQVKACFQWAENQGRIDKNPLARVSVGGFERRADLPDDAIDKLCALTSRHYGRAVRWLRLTACRVGEMCRMEWPHLDLDRGIWVIKKHKSLKRTGKARVVALVDDAVKLAKEIRAEWQAIGRPLAGVVFLNQKGRPWNRRTMSQKLYRLKRDGQLPADGTLHGIRHRALGAAVAAGAPIKLVAEQAGHASVTTTERYYCDLTNEVDAIREAMERGIPKRPE